MVSVRASSICESIPIRFARKFGKLSAGAKRGNSTEIHLALCDFGKKASGLRVLRVFKYERLRDFIHAMRCERKS